MHEQRTFSGSISIGRELFISFIFTEIPRVLWVRCGVVVWLVVFLNIYLKFSRYLLSRANICVMNIDVFLCLVVLKYYECKYVFTKKNRG